MVKANFERAKGILKKLPQTLQNEIWLSSTLTEKTKKGRVFAVLRLLAIIVDGVRANRIPSQAAALSYYTLIALGPMIAIAIMISGFVIRDNQEEIAVNALTKLVYFIAPSAETASDRELDMFFNELDEENSLTLDPALEPEQQMNPEISKFITSVVNNARSGAVGVIGSFMLIIISIQLFSTIEKTFNTIWGVRQGRSFFQRIVFYWTFMSLGTVVAFAALTMDVYQKAVDIVETPFAQIDAATSDETVSETTSEATSDEDNHTLNSELLQSALQLSLSFLSFTSIAFMLTFFNRAIPNTPVHWRPALLGGLMVTLLLFLNKKLTFLYIGLVIRQQSLFGSVGILPVLLFGLFIFWLFLLLGGQITYSAQNVNTLSNQRAWDNVSLRSRETLCLAAFVLIARRFDNCLPPCSAFELATKLRAPSHIINSTLIKLGDMGYIQPIESRNKHGNETIRYQPARPLEKITLNAFKESFDTLGTNESLVLYRDLDPLLSEYEQSIINYEPSGVEMKSIRDLFATHPIKDEEADAVALK